MRDFLTWFDERQFLVSSAWDFEEQEWVPGPQPLVLFDFQRRILSEAFKLDEKGRMQYDTIVYSTTKKSGKTTIGAAVGAWVAEEYPPSSEIFVCAVDKDQAWERMYGDIAYHVLHSGIAKPLKYRIEFPNQTFIQALANEFASAAGSRHALSLWDELWGMRTDNHYRMWAEMTPPPTVRNAFRFIATYAGFENESILLHDLYQNAWVEGEVIPELSDIVNRMGDPICRRKGRIFVMWDDVPRFPWQTDAYYEDQMATLRPSDFLRMHRNQWCTSSEGFIDINMWDRNVKLDGPLYLKRDDKRLNYPVYLGIDIGTKHDCSAVVGVYYDLEKERIGLASDHIWNPEGTYFDIEGTVEKTVLDLCKVLNVVAVPYDPSQFHRSAFTLRNKGVPMVEFTQTAGPMTEATQMLFTLLSTNNIDLYESPELRNHMKYATAVNTPRGFRLQKGKNAKYKIDASLALVMAIWQCLNGAAPRNFDAIHLRFPFGDVAGAEVDPNEMLLPEPFRRN